LKTNILVAFNENAINLKGTDLISDFCDSILKLPMSNLITYSVIYAAQNY